MTSEPVTELSLTYSLNSVLVGDSTRVEGLGTLTLYCLQTTNFDDLNSVVIRQYTVIYRLCYLITVGGLTKSVEYCYRIVMNYNENYFNKKVSNKIQNR